MLWRELCLLWAGVSGVTSVEGTAPAGRFGDSLRVRSSGEGAYCGAEEEAVRGTWLGVAVTLSMGHSEGDCMEDIVGDGWSACGRRECDMLKVSTVICEVWQWGWCSDHKM